MVSSTGSVTEPRLGAREKQKVALELPQGAPSETGLYGAVRVKWGSQKCKGTATCLTCLGNTTPAVCSQRAASGKGQDAVGVAAQSSQPVLPLSENEVLNLKI